MLKIRDIETVADVKAMVEIAERCHDFPAPTSNDTIVGRVVENGSGPVAYGIIKVFAEAIFVPDLTKPRVELGKSLMLLMKDAIEASQRANVEQLHTFVKDEEFVELLKRHYGFVECSGKALVLEVPGGEGGS